MVVWVFTCEDAAATRTAQWGNCELERQTDTHTHSEREREGGRGLMSFLSVQVCVEMLLYLFEYD